MGWFYNLSCQWGDAPLALAIPFRLIAGPPWSSTHCLTFTTLIPGQRPNRLLLREGLR